jgi:type II secretory pathway component PulC
MTCVRSLPFLLAIGLFGCGSSPPPAPMVPAASAVKDPAQAAADAPTTAPTKVLRRSAVHEVVTKGLGYFLQRVAIDDKPVFVAGKFHGFRITALNGEGWRGIDLQPGDVVTHVNGFPIERPEQAMEAFKSLDVASELRVDYERDGVPRELRFSIIDS